MRINSATIGMESERTYSATHARMSRLTRFSGKQSIMDGSGTLFGGFLQTDGENAEQSKDKKGVGNESLADIQGRMTNTRLNSQAISDMDDIREQMRQLRESESGRNRICCTSTHSHRPIVPYAVDRSFLRSNWRPQ